MTLFWAGNRVRATAAYMARLNAFFPDGVTPDVRAILTQKGTVKSVSLKMLPALVEVEWDGGKTGTIAANFLTHLDAVEALAELA